MTMLVLRVSRPSVQDDQNLIAVADEAMDVATEDTAGDVDLPTSLLPEMLPPMMSLPELAEEAEAEAIVDPEYHVAEHESIAAELPQEPALQASVELVQAEVEPSEPSGLDNAASLVVNLSLIHI